MGHWEDRSTRQTEKKRKKKQEKKTKNHRRTTKARRSPRTKTKKSNNNATTVGMGRGEGLAGGWAGGARDIIDATNTSSHVKGSYSDDRSFSPPLSPPPPSPPPPPVPNAETAAPFCATERVMYGVVLSAVRPPHCYLLPPPLSAMLSFFKEVRRRQHAAKKGA